MQGHIAETEALETRSTRHLLLVAASAQVWSDQTGVVIGVGLDKGSKRGVACTKQVYDFIADGSGDLGDTLGDQGAACGVAGGEAVQVEGPPGVCSLKQVVTLRD